MDRQLLADLAGLLDRARKEAGAAFALLSDGNGIELARAGDDGTLPPPARAFFSKENLRRLALALDDEDPDLLPPPEQTGGARIYGTRVGSLVLSLVFGSEVSPREVREWTRSGVSRVRTYLEGFRRERRRRFLGFHLTTRVCDKTYVMSAEVRGMLEGLCDCLLDMREALEMGADCTHLVSRFQETLGELVAWPKGGGESFQRNLEILQRSVEDLRAADLTSERLEAIESGLEVTIESWPLP
jgi:hypothetical protein